MVKVVRCVSFCLIWGMVSHLNSSFEGIFQVVFQYFFKNVSSEVSIGQQRHLMLGLCHRLTSLFRLSRYIDFPISDFQGEANTGTVVVVVMSTPSVNELRLTRPFLLYLADSNVFNYPLSWRSTAPGMRQYTLIYLICPGLVTSI